MHYKHKKCAYDWKGDALYIINLYFPIIIASLFKYDGYNICTSSMIMFSCNLLTKHGEKCDLFINRMFAVLRRMLLMFLP
jgi:hypothetical protein